MFFNSIRPQLSKTAFTNNVIGLTASIALPLFAWKIGQKSEARIYIVLDSQRPEIAISSTF